MNSKRYDVLVVGELNVDLILHQVPHLPKLGNEIFAQSMDLTLGSSAAIFAHNLSRFGCQVAFAGKLGNDVFGKVVLEHLKEAGVETSYIQLDEKASTGASIGIQHQGDRGTVTYAGAMQEFTLADVPLHVLDEVRHVHFSSYFFQPAFQKDLSTLFQLAKQKGLSTSFDMQCDPDDQWNMDYKSILPFVDVFLPNEKEIQLLTQASCLEEAIAHLRPYTNILALKRGSKGSLVLTPNESLQHAGFQVASYIDAIGAGDSFNAGFIYKFLQGQPLSVCQEYGNIAGAHSTTKAGGVAAFSQIKNFDIYVSEHFKRQAACLT
jgi:sugar/nucleoside kinase (ribokinase family)